MVLRDVNFLCSQIAVWIRYSGNCSEGVVVGWLLGGRLVVRLTGPDRTGPICKQSGPEFWDWTEVRSHGPVFIFETGLCTVPKTNGTGPHCGPVLFFETEPSQSGGKRLDQTVVNLHIVGIADKSNG